jgi:predicted aspartyl protease
MSFPFNPRHGLILVQAEVEGPSGLIRLRLALDTGATTTIIDPSLLIAIGYDPNSVQNRVPVTTGSAVVTAPLLPVIRMRALGQERLNFQLLSHSLPPSAGVDGLLGLDFLRGRLLTVDFTNGVLTLA